jgi:hypothetical protein
MEAEQKPQQAAVAETLVAEGKQTEERHIAETQTAAQEAGP